MGVDSGNGRDESIASQAGEVKKKPSVDEWSQRIVTLSLGCTVVFTGLNITILSFSGHEIPPALPLLGTTALGALAGLLANNGKH